MGPFVTFIALISVLLPSSADQMSEFASGKAAHSQHNKVARGVTDFSIFPDKSQGPQKYFTWAEVERGDAGDGRRILIVLDRQVYDVTDFADLHPPGRDFLEKYAGRDASAAMRATAMPSEVYDTQIKLFKVGSIVSTEPEGSCESPNN